MPAATLLKLISEPAFRISTICSGVAHPTHRFRVISLIVKAAISLPLSGLSATLLRSSFIIRDSQASARRDASIRKVNELVNSPPEPYPEAAARVPYIMDRAIKRSIAPLSETARAALRKRRVKWSEDSPLESISCLNQLKSLESHTYELWELLDFIRRKPS